MKPLLPGMLYRLPDSRAPHACPAVRLMTWFHTDVLLHLLSSARILSSSFLFFGPLWGSLAR